MTARPGPHVARARDTIAVLAGTVVCAALSHVRALSCALGRVLQARKAVVELTGIIMRTVLSRHGKTHVSGFSVTTENSLSRQKSLRSLSRQRNLCRNIKL